MEKQDQREEKKTLKRPLRILVVANKTWECEPLVNVLMAGDARPETLINHTRGYDPAEKRSNIKSRANLRGNLPIRPRLKLDIGTTKIKNNKKQIKIDGHVEVWCIEDWMRKDHKKLKGKRKDISSSSSREKFCFSLPQIKKHCFKGENPDIIIAFGTAGIPTQYTMNGCVTIGTRIYINNPWDDATKEEIDDQKTRFGPLLVKKIEKHFKKRIDSPKLKSTLFSKDLQQDLRYAAEARFIKPPINPADNPRLLAGHGYASLGTINICDYDDYIWADAETLHRFETQVRQHEIGSMETTHCLIRLTWENTPFIFVSGLTDTVLRFNAEVTPRKYAQNFVAAHNGGISLAYLLPDLCRLHKEGNLYK